MYNSLGGSRTDILLTSIPSYWQLTWREFRDDVYKYRELVTALIAEKGVSEAECEDIFTRFMVATTDLAEWNVINGARLDYLTEMRDIADAIKNVGYDEFYRGFVREKGKGPTLATDTHTRQHSKKEIASVANGADYHRFQRMLGERATLKAHVTDITSGFSDFIKKRLETGQPLLISQAKITQFDEDLRAHMRANNPADGDALDAICFNVINYWGDIY